jgi:ABC-type phosphate transport system permease subunit
VASICTITSFKALQTILCSTGVFVMCSSLTAAAQTMTHTDTLVHGCTSLWCRASLAKHSLMALTGCAGYGDAVPRSLAGRLVGSLTMIFGLMIIALPITVIGTNFSTVYREMLAAREPSAPEHTASSRSRAEEQ